VAQQEVKKCYYTKILFIEFPLCKAIFCGSLGFGRDDTEGGGIVFYIINLFSLWFSVANILLSILTVMFLVLRRAISPALALRASVFVFVGFRGKIKGSDTFFLKK